jgi:hypothetical protein
MAGFIVDHGAGLYTAGCLDDEVGEPPCRVIAIAALHAAQADASEAAVGVEAAAVLFIRLLERSKGLTASVYLGFLATVQERLVLQELVRLY